MTGLQVWKKHTRAVIQNFHRNICHKLNDFSHHCHNEDAISVQRIIEELRLENPSPVLFYKAQGQRDPEHPNLAEDTFLLILITSFQAEMFSSKIVCLDSTHKTNQYRFKLITGAVPDEYHNGMLMSVFITLHTCKHNLGQPVAWAIADKEDADTLEVLWKAIKICCPNTVV